ncbi:NUDIX hydrolase [Pyrolobus fumarii 1A]|uniref:NUDIX hydrolase n=1 Tax=Pyrolobus fumarii (strain DSM 11204 / 1A) TaxID=694429 RepID=G0EDF8_PYRF1|nr:NUDIX hydrolase [Pyrolobus fumarii]AEM38643.1 NUDIX hydrolase [Pyrolobus fumarii 1A]
MDAEEERLRPLNLWGPVLRALRARSPILASSILLLNNGKVLLVKRASEPYRGYWSLPGGRVEHGEDTLSAALRELREETGIADVKVDGIAGIAEVMCTNYHFLIIVFWGRSSSQPRASSDAEDARWFGWGELTRLKLTPSTRTFLEAWEPGIKLRIICRCGECILEKI